MSSEHDELRTHCCIFQSTTKFACEFEIEKDAERKSPSNEMSALRELASGQRYGVGEDADHPHEFGA